jgi:hypothetical protein
MSGTISRGHVASAEDGSKGHVFNMRKIKAGSLREFAPFYANIADITVRL